MSDLIERLRKEGSGHSNIKLEAANEIERSRNDMPKIRSLIATAYQEVREFEDYNNALSHMLDAIELIESHMGYYLKQR